MIFKKGWLYTTVLILVLLVVGYFLVSTGDAADGDDDEPFSTSSLPEEKKDNATTAKDVLPVKVEVSQVFVGDLVKRVSAYGNAEAIRIVKIHPETSGRVAKIGIKDGSIVKKGDLLFALDNEEAKIGLRKAEDILTRRYSDFLAREMDYRGNIGSIKDRLAKVEAKFKETEINYKKGLISRSDYEEEKRILNATREAAKLDRDKVRLSAADVTSSRLNVESAKIQLRKSRSHAPFRGVVADLKIVEGQQVSPGGEALTLVDYGTVKIVADVLENEIPALKVERKVKIDFLAIEGRTYKGTIASISPLIDKERRIGKVIIYIENRGFLIKPGMMARIRLDAHIFKDRLLVPRSSVLERDSKRLVFIVKDGRAQWEYVRTGLENEEYIEITPDPGIGVHGVHEGDTVIISGHYSLAHNTKVRY